MQGLLRFFSRITIRLLAFNILLVFIPAAALLSLRTYEAELLRWQERSMVQQGRLLAAALGEQGPLTPEAVESILINMDQQFDARLRVVDADFSLLADSSRLGPRLETPGAGGGGEGGEVPEPPGPEEEIRRSVLYRLGNLLYQLYHRLFLPPEPPRRDAGFYASDRKLVGTEIEAALSGTYGATSRKTPGERSLTLYSALPIRSGSEVVGAVLVSKSTFQILGSVYELRLAIFEVVLLSAGVAVILSLILSTTIARPILKLRQRALAILDRRGRLMDTIEPYQRLDEIGDLSRALAELTRRLEKHLKFIESFASDVSHELKNPLASIRTATDLLAEVEEPEERQRFLSMVQRDIARLERLLSGVREVSRIDATLDTQPTESVDLLPLLEAIVESRELRHADVRLRLEVGKPEEDEVPIRVNASPDRLVQVVENLVDNAIGFSPDNGEVLLELGQAPDAKEPDLVSIRILDQGPGIPPEHLEKIFHRFFSYREKESGARRGKLGHTGLGLAIVRAIVEGYGGTVTAANRDDAPSGAVFEVRLPSARNPRTPNLLKTS